MDLADQFFPGLDTEDVNARRAMFRRSRRAGSSASNPARGVARGFNPNVRANLDPALIRRVQNRNRQRTQSRAGARRTR